MENSISEKEIEEFEKEYLNNPMFGDSISNIIKTSYLCPIEGGAIQGTHTFYGMILLKVFIV
jgi:hypothetical protein